MSAAVDAGAAMINDVRALQEPGALVAAAQAGVPVCLMHMQGQPRTMQQAPRYSDVVAEVRDYLARRVQDCLQAGIPHELLITDPGFGFGKTREHNFRLLRELSATRIDGLPILAGLSRKSMIGQTLDLPVGDRMAASIALALLAVINGANIVRVHDVRETWQALRMQEAVSNDGVDG
jgi:dihydropteroate synthase